MDTFVIVERWEAKDDGRVCAGCRYMQHRLFLAGEGPRPPLHHGCRCRRVGVELVGLSGVALLAVAASLRRNAARSEELVSEARRRRVREEARLRGVGRMARRLARRGRRRAERQKGAGV